MPEEKIEEKKVSVKNFNPFEEEEEEDMFADVKVPPGLPVPPTSKLEAITSQTIVVKKPTATLQ